MGKNSAIAWTDHSEAVERHHGTLDIEIAVIGINVNEGETDYE